MLKSVCTVFRTVSAVESMAITLGRGAGASKLVFTLDCRMSGIRKTYGVACNADAEILQAAVDKDAYPTLLVLSPRHLSRLLSNFQNNLQEITLIVTEPTGDGGGSESQQQDEKKAIQMCSFVDPIKGASETSLGTKLWIDPANELEQYRHVGDPVDVTFSVKELKAFVTFCEATDAHIACYIDQTGSPVLFMPHFGSNTSDFSAQLVLATMMESQLGGAGPAPGNPQEGDRGAHAPPHHAQQAGTGDPFAFHGSPEGRPPNPDSQRGRPAPSASASVPSSAPYAHEDGYGGGAGCTHPHDERGQGPAEPAARGGSLPSQGAGDGMHSSALHHGMHSSLQTPRTIVWSEVTTGPSAQTAGVQHPREGHPTGAEHSPADRINRANFANAAAKAMSTLAAVDEVPDSQEQGDRAAHGGPRDEDDKAGGSGDDDDDDDCVQATPTEKRGRYIY
eukprot:jgi/Mesvir1/23703/Mv18652-RA.1